MTIRRNKKASLYILASALFCASVAATVEAQAEDRGARAGATTPSTAADRASLLMDTLGGAEVWKQGYVDYEAVTVKVSETEAPLLFEFWFHLRQPKTMVRVRRFNQEQVRLFDGDKGWTITRGEGRQATVKSWSVERVAQELHDWNTSPAVQFARLARGEAGFEAVEDHEKFPGWLLFRKDGENLLYLDTDIKTGAPATMFQVGINNEPTILKEPKDAMGFRIMSGGLSNGKTPFDVLHARLVQDDAEISFTLKGALEQFDLTAQE